MPFKSPLPPVPLETQPYGERMLDVLWRRGAANPTKKAMICAENPQFSVTYHELYHGSRSVAAFLETQGFKKGDVLLTVLPNSWEFFEVMIGAALRGIIVTTASMLFTEYELEKQIQDSGATVIFCSDDRLERVLAATKNIDQVKEIVVAQLSDRSKKLDTNFGDRVISFEDVLATKPSDNFATAKIDVKKDVFLLPYSSGTTGARKGVMISHELFSTMITTVSSHFAKNVYSNLNPNREIQSENVLLDLPFCFIYGGAMLQMSLVLGQTVIVMRHFDEEVYLRSVQEYKVHFLFLLPPVLIMLANSPNVENYDLSSVQGAMSSGAPASIHICRKTLKRLPNLKRIDQGYGMTETSGACTLPIMDESTTVMTHSHYAHRMGHPQVSSRMGHMLHSGVILPNYEMKLVDSEGQEVPFGEGGELLIRAPAMMLGYIGKPEATADAFSDGWYKTGDIARIDENGLVYIVGRSKDVIKSQGAQASPTELEDVLLSHPDILDAGVIPVPLEDGDEGFFAFIVRKNDLSKEDIHNFVNNQVAEFKRLRAGITLVDAIPKSDTGKILRNVLKDMYKKGT